MTDIEMVRLNIQDEVMPFTFATPVIETLLGQYNNDVNLASSHLWLLRAGSNSLRNFKYNVDGRTVDKTMQAKECREQAAVFKELAMSVPADDVVDIDWTNAFDPPEGV